MKIDEHIKNLEEYCEVDNLFEKDGDFKEFCDNHIADIKAVIEELKNTQSDLGDKDRMINEMAKYIDDDDLYEYVVDCIRSNSWCTLENYKAFLEEKE